MEFLNDFIVKSPFIKAKPLKNFKNISQHHSQQFIELFETMHNIGIAHGDLMPRNILIDDEKITIVDWEQMCPDISTRNKSLDLNGIKNCNHYGILTAFSPPIFAGCKHTMNLLNLRLKNNNLFNKNILLKSKKIL
jgi:serine/threonine-protein kinase RIO1